MLKEDLLIRSGDSTAAAISPAPPEVQVTAPGGVTMRAQTKSDSNVVRSLADGSRVTVLGVLGSWCCVRSEDQAGFVPRAQLSGDIGGYARTKENKLADAQGRHEPERCAAARTAGTPRAGHRDQR